MRTLTRVEEFKREANNAIFTKQQAISVTLRLLEMELADSDNSERDKQVLNEAMRRINFTYLDSTKTDTDAMLDSIGVARFSAEHIVSAIEYAVFEANGR